MQLDPVRRESDVAWGPHEALIYSIESWSLDGSRPEEILARACSVDIGHAAYQAGKLVRPNGRVLLRYGAHLIRDSVVEAAAARGERIEPTELQPRQLTQGDIERLRQRDD